MAMMRFSSLELHEVGLLAVGQGERGGKVLGKVGDLADALEDGSVC